MIGRVLYKHSTERKYGALKVFPEMNIRRLALSYGSVAINTTIY